MKPTVFAALALAAALLLASADAATTPQYVSYSSHTDSACASVPKQAAYVAQSATSSDCASPTCVADAATGLYLFQTCVADPTTRSASLFGTKPWVQFEIYEPNSVCATLASVIAYLADGSCIVVDNASSSVRAAVYANKSATIATFDGTSCTGSATKTNTIPTAQLARSSCIEGLLLASTGNATTDATAGNNHAVGAAVPSTLMTLLAIVTAVVAVW